MVLFDMACDRILELFKIKNLKNLQTKALAQRSWQMVSMFVFEIQSTVPGSLQ